MACAARPSRCGGRTSADRRRTSRDVGAERAGTRSVAPSNRAGEAVRRFDVAKLHLAPLRHSSRRRHQLIADGRRQGSAATSASSTRLLFCSALATRSIAAMPASASREKRGSKRRCDRWRIPAQMLAHLDVVGGRGLRHLVRHFRRRFPFRSLPEHHRPQVDRPPAESRSRPSGEAGCNLGALAALIERCPLPQPPTMSSSGRSSCPASGELSSSSSPARSGHGGRAPPSFSSSHFANLMVAGPGVQPSPSTVMSGHLRNASLYPPYMPVWR